MPEIDTELFQWLVLGLLVLLVLIALISTSILSKIAKQPMTSSPAPASEAERAPADRAAEPPATGSTPEAAETGRESWEPTYTSDVGALTGSESAPATTAPEPAVTSAPEPAVTSEPAVPQEEAPAAAAEPVPEEEPFEREGRWWFKRGDELLVYDEGSGQWQPAPAGSFPVTTSAAPATGSVYSGGGEDPAATGSEAAPAEAAQPSGGQAEGGFWKCTSCGAINGATAASCRMCFTARP